MSAGNQFVPLTLGLIEEGEFLKAANDAIHRAQHELAMHVSEWGERAGKAKAEVQITIKLGCESTDDGIYSIEPVLRIKLPSRPPRVTAAFAGPITNGGKTTGEMALFVRGTGSTPGDPTQMHLPMGDKQEEEGSQADAHMG